MIDESDPGEPKGEKHEPLPNARRMTEQECDAIYAAWDGGLRSSVSLGEKFGWSDETVRVLIKHGNKRRGWQPFALRKALEESTLKAATDVAKEKIASRVVDQWEKAKEWDLALIQGNKKILGEMLQKFIEVVKKVDFSTMSASAACNNARSLAAAVDTLVKAESLLLGKPTERQEINPGDGWTKLTPEQLEYIAANGKLPPDVSEDVLFGTN